MDKLTSEELYEEFLLLRTDRLERDPIEKTQQTITVLRLNKRRLEEDLEVMITAGLQTYRGKTHEQFQILLDSVTAELQRYQDWMEYNNRSGLDEDLALALSLQDETSASLVRQSNGKYKNVVMADLVIRGILKDRLSLRQSVPDSALEWTQINDQRLVHPRIPLEGYVNLFIEIVPRIERMYLYDHKGSLIVPKSTDPSRQSYTETIEKVSLRVYEHYRKRCESNASIKRLEIYAKDSMREDPPLLALSYKSPSTICAVPSIQKETSVSNEN